MTRTYPVDRSIELPARMFLDLEKHAGHNAALSYLLVLEGALTPAQVRSAVESLKTVNPRLSQRVSRGSSGDEEWVPADAECPIDFVELPTGSDTADVLDRCSKLQERVFDRDRPLWRVVYFAPMRDGRSALLVQLHHSLGDGAATLAIVTGAFGHDAVHASWVDVPRHDSPAPAIAESNAGDDGGTAQGRPDGPETTAGLRNSRSQRVVVLDARPRTAWEAVAARYGVEPHTVFVALAVATMFGYWKSIGAAKDSALLAMPTPSEKIREVAGGLFAIHVPYVTVTTDLVRPGHLAQLSRVLATEMRTSEQQGLDLVTVPAGDAVGMTPPTPAGVGGFSPPTSDLQAMDYGGVPALAVEGHPVIDFSGFAPATGTGVAFTLMCYDDVIKVCANVDSAPITDQQVFDESAAAAVKDLVGESASPVFG